MSVPNRLGILAAAAILSALATLGACTTEEGSTPHCTPDVDDAGNRHIDGGCNAFPSCPVDPNDPAKCCKDKMGCDFQNCMYGYGVVVDGGGCTVGPSGSGGAAGGGGRA